MHAQGGAAAGEAVGRAGQGRGEGDAVEEEQGQGLEGGGGGEESRHSRVKGVVDEVMTIRRSECSNITIFLFQEQSHKIITTDHKRQNMCFGVFCKVNPVYTSSKLCEFICLSV